MSLRKFLSAKWDRFQGWLFPELQKEVGPLGEKHEQLVIVLDTVPIDAIVPSISGVPGRPLSERRCLIRAFIAKAVFQLPTTVALIDRLNADQPLRRLCGWESFREVPSESTFSRAFAEFANNDLPDRLHALMIKAAYKDEVVGHISRDATAIKAREKPCRKPAAESLPPAAASAAASSAAETAQETPKPKRKRGRRRKDAVAPLLKKSMIDKQKTMPLEQMPAVEPLPPAAVSAAAPPSPPLPPSPAVETAQETPEPKRSRGRPRKDAVAPPPKESMIDKQKTMSLEQMLDALPKKCDVGIKRNAKGYRESWIGYGFHIDTADGDVPVSAILTSASLHDSQVSIPLSEKTKSHGIINCYDLMDAAYDAKGLRDHSESLGHVPIIDINPRNNKALKEELLTEAKRLKAVGHTMPEDVRYNQRSSAERVNSQLHDNYGGRTLRVRGYEKVKCHLMIGVLCITAIQLMRMTI